MENIMGTEMQGIQKMGYQETILLSIQVHVLFFDLVWSLRKRIVKSDFNAVMLNCNNWGEFWRILWLNTDETCE